MIVAGTEKCVNHLVLVSFINRMKSPCVEGPGLAHCGNYKLNIFHYQLFICCEESTAFSLVITPRGENIGWEVSVFTSPPSPPQK